MIVVITGGAGFIGSNLVRYLKARGNEVILIDDLSLGRVDNLPPGIRLIVGDVASAAVWSQISTLDAIVHLAGASSTPMFLDFAAGLRDLPCSPWSTPV